MVLYMYTLHILSYKIVTVTQRNGYLASLPHPLRTEEGTEKCRESR